MSSRCDIRRIVDVSCAAVVLLTLQRQPSLADALLFSDGYGAEEYVSGRVIDMDSERIVFDVECGGLLIGVPWQGNVVVTFSDQCVNAPILHGWGGPQDLCGGYRFKYMIVAEIDGVETFDGSDRILQVDGDSFIYVAITDGTVRSIPRSAMTTVAFPSGCD